MELKRKEEKKALMYYLLVSTLLHKDFINEEAIAGFEISVSNQTIINSRSGKIR